MLKGSPNIHGSSAILAESFADGASEAGHDVRLVDVTHANIHPCLGCIRCGYEGPCAQKDGMKKLKADILKSDMLVFVTPLYYYGFSSQLKIVIESCGCPTLRSVITGLSFLILLKGTVFPAGGGPLIFGENFENSGQIRRL